MDNKDLDECEQNVLLNYNIPLILNYIYYYPFYYSII